jgi:hypothetical protein
MKVFFGVFFIGLSLLAGDLEALYNSDAKSLSAEKFVSTYPQFKWGGANKRIAMTRGSTLFSHRVREGIGYFNSTGKLTRLDSWVYNRGDDGNMSKDNFEKKYNSLLVELGSFFKTKPKKSGISGATRSTAYTYTLKNRDQVSLLVGFEKKPYRADFICLVYRNYGRNDRLRGSDTTKKYVKKLDNGDVFIDKIPMIDQGPKGYCVPATLARIGQHYGVDISMHEIAMISDSSSSGGTSVQAALGSLSKKYARVRLRIKKIRVSCPGVYSRSGSISSSAAKAIYDKTSDDDSKFKKYYSEVKKRIDKGQMVAWSMVVGLLPENGRPAQQSGGGHMRMFIGYNDKTKELIFSDSWGPGHEMKRITAKAAFVVTSGIYEISP